MKKYVKYVLLLGVVFMSLFLSGCSEQLTEQDKAALENGKAAALQYYSDKYGKTAEVKDASFDYSYGLFNTNYHTNQMNYTLSDGTIVICFRSEERFMDNAQAFEATEALRKYLDDGLKATGVDIRMQNPAEFNRQYIGEGAASGFFTARFDGDCEAFLEEEGTVFANLGRMILAVPAKQLKYDAEALDEAAIKKGEPAFIPGNSGFEKDIEKVSAVLDKFCCEFFTEIVVITDENLERIEKAEKDPFEIRSGDRYCEYAVKIFESDRKNRMEGYTQDRIYLGGDMFIVSEVAAMPLREGDIRLEKTDLRLEDLESKVKDKKFEERPEEYTVYRIETSERLKDYMKTVSHDYFALEVRKNSAGGDMHVWVDGNRITQNRWKDDSGGKRLVYFYPGQEDYFVVY